MACLARVKPLFPLMAALVLSACQTVTPEQVAKALKVITPEGDGPFPVVIYYQGTGGHNRRQQAWATWFKTHGVASAIVDNAWVHDRFENPTGSRYTGDGAIAWDLLKSDKRIDTDRFALMGFSRGGGMTLMAGDQFGNERAVPSFAFALYPGGFGARRCPTNHEDQTDVHIFFGDKDDVGNADKYLTACRGTARQNENVSYHHLPGATHGYDEPHSYTFGCCKPRITVQVQPNSEAVAATREVIEKAIKGRWER